MLIPQEGDVLLIRTTPVKILLTEREQEGRFIISQIESKAKFNWYTEDKIQEMLAAAGVTELPPPEPWSPVTSAVDAVTIQTGSSTDQTPEPRPSERRFIKTPRGSGSEPAADASSASPQVAETVVSNPWLSLMIVALVGAVLAFFLLRKKRKE